MKAKTCSATIILCFIICSIGTAPHDVTAQTSESPIEQWSPCSSPEARQFDFWAGEWDVQNLVLHPEKGWVDAGRATNRVYTLLDGCAVIEHWEGEFRGNPLYGFSIRAFDPSKKKWVLVLNWTGKGSRSFGILEGEFRHGRGEFFFSTKDREGKEIRGRYSFSDINEKTFRWDSSRSTDGGMLWHTDWIMEFTRRDAMSDLPLFNGPARSHSLCSEPETREFDFMTGEWEGVRQIQQADGSRQDERVRLQSLAILGGCASMEFLESVEGEHRFKEFRVRALDPSSKRWVEYSINNRNPVFRRLEGNYKDSVAELRTSASSNNLARTRWSEISADSVSRESASSTDGGKTWNTVSKIAFKRKR